MHAMHRDYVDHLRKTEQPYDYEAAEEIENRYDSKEARSLFHDWYQRSIFEPERIYGTEVQLSLDENFEPCAREVAVYSGDFDRLELDGQTATVIDLKSNFAAFNPTTIQSIFYPWLLSKTLKHIDKIVFELHFVRYNIIRRREFDLVEIAVAEKEIMALVARIVAAWEKNDWPATPCSQCSFCVLECPLVVAGMKREAIGQVGTEERATMLAGELYVMEMRAKRLKEQLKAYVSENGPIHMDHGQALGFVKRTSQEYDVQHTRALNEEHGFDKNRALAVDNQEIKRIKKRYPEFVSRLEKTKKDASTTIFGFRNEMEEE